MKFALRNKVPRDREEHLKEKHHYVQEAKNSILDTLGIGHAKKTKVGNEFIRGVSGGERKRVSLAEMMAGQVRPIKWTLILANIHLEPNAILGSTNSGFRFKDRFGVCDYFT